jgi:hypothetical protein
MTATPADPAISELRELFKNLLLFRSIFRESGVEEFSSPAGNTWSIWDLEYLYRQCDRLTLRQRQAITLCLVHNMRESDGAEAMGLKDSNPVMMYATLGLRRLLDLVESGELDRFRADDHPTDLRRKQVRSLHQLADRIRAGAHVTPRHGCWLFPSARARTATRLRIPSIYHSSGFTIVDPMVVMYQAHVGPLPPHFRIVHPEFGRNPLACVNYQHGELTMTEEGKRRQESLHRRYRHQAATRRVS